LKSVQNCNIKPA